MPITVDDARAPTAAPRTVTVTPHVLPDTALMDCVYL